MSEKLKYVSPEYQAQLEALAETLCDPRRFGEVALQGVLFELDDPADMPNVVLGED